jgi:hypothetical protein
VKSPSAHILVTCTKRKRLSPPGRLRLGSVGKGSPIDVAKRWAQRLQQSDAPRVRAASLYAGDHWQIAASLPAVAAGCGVKAQLWVLSAGYGLISSCAAISPYSATFSAGHPDEVLTRFTGRDGKEAVREWWAALSSCPGPETNAPRRITDLARQNPGVPILVVASPKYLAAAQDDLVEAATALADPAMLIVVSAGGRGRGPLAANMLDCSARFQPALGGALMSLNARVARRVLEQHPPYPWTVSGFQELLERLPMAESKDPAPLRRPVSDDEVRAYVRSSLRENPSARHTALLRLYREAGHACEQKRFGRLFKEVEQSHAGTK